VKFYSSEYFLVYSIYINKCYVADSPKKSSDAEIIDLTETDDEDDDMGMTSSHLSLSSGCSSNSSVVPSSPPAISPKEESRPLLGSSAEGGFSLSGTSSSSAAGQLSGCVSPGVINIDTPPQISVSPSSLPRTPKISMSPTLSLSRSPYSSQSPQTSSHNSPVSMPLSSAPGGQTTSSSSASHSPFYLSSSHLQNISPAHNSSSRSAHSPVRRSPSLAHSSFSPSLFSGSSNSRASPSSLMHPPPAHSNSYSRSSLNAFLPPFSSMDTASDFEDFFSFMSMPNASSLLSNPYYPSPFSLPLSLTTHHSLHYPRELTRSRSPIDDKRGLLNHLSDS
jgi:hypothetical protein